jgi:uncharacterized protein with HEPN domain
MKNKRDSKDFLQDILENAKKIIVFTKGIEFKSFKKNDEKIYAVLRALEVIGEGAKKIPNSIRRRYPHVPWEDMAGMRNKLIHEYFGVDLAVVWKTVEKDLPPLIQSIKQVLKEIDCLKG